MVIDIVDTSLPTPPFLFPRRAGTLGARRGGLVGTFLLEHSIEFAGILQNIDLIALQTGVITRVTTHLAGGLGMGCGVAVACLPKAHNDHCGVATGIDQ